MRKNLREQCYYKFLNGAVSRSFPLGHVNLEYTLFSYPEVNSILRDQLSKLLQRPVLVYATAENGLCILAKDSEALNGESLILKACQIAGRSIRVVIEDGAKGLLLGLLNGKGRFLGLGTLKSIDIELRILGVLTSNVKAPNVICFGRIRLDEGFREIGFTQDYEQ